MQKTKSWKEGLQSLPLWNKRWNTTLIEVFWQVFMIKREWYHPRISLKYVSFKYKLHVINSSHVYMLVMLKHITFSLSPTSLAFDTRTFSASSFWSLPFTSYKEINFVLSKPDILKTLVTKCKLHDNTVKSINGIVPKSNEDFTTTSFKVPL